MKRILKISLLTAIVAILASCSSEVSDDDFNPINRNIDTDAKTNTITFSFGNIDAEATDVITYAESRAVDTHGMERRVISVAVFIEDNTGKLHKYLSNTDNTYHQDYNYGFEDVVYGSAEIDDDGISRPVSAATVKLPVDDIQDIRNIAIVANHYHRDVDITADLLKIESWEKLVKFEVPAAKRGVWLNLGHLAYKVLTREEIRALDGAEECTVKLKRHCARIRPKLHVLSAVEGKGPASVDWKSLANRYENSLFSFCELIVYNPKSAAFLLPDPLLVTKDDITAIPQYERFDPRDFNGYSLDLYFYEMTGHEPEPLVMYLTYKYRPNENAEWHWSTSGFMIENQAGKCILEQNTAYEVDLTITVPISAATISDWDKGWNLTGKQ